MNQHYEWKKATSDNLPKDKNKRIPIRLGKDYGFYLGSQIDPVKDPGIEYLAEVAPIEWPGDEQIKAKFEEHYALPRSEYNYFKVHFAPIIDWLKQVTIK